MKPSRTALPAIGVLTLAVAFAGPLVNLSAVATPVAAPTPGLTFTMEPVKALDGKYCRPFVLNAPALMIADCEEGPIVLKDGKQQEVKRDTAEFTVNEFSVQAANEAGWMAGAGKCTRKKDNAPTQPCVLRWNPAGELRAQMLHEIGSPLADVGMVNGINRQGDIAFTEIFSDGQMHTFDARIWWAKTNRFTPVVPNRYGAAVLVRGLTDDGMVTGSQFGGTDTPPPAPTSAPVPSTTPTTSTPTTTPPSWPTATSAPAPTASAPTTAPAPPGWPTGSPTAPPMPTAVPTGAPSVTVTRPPVPTAMPTVTERPPVPTAAPTDTATRPPITPSPTATERPPVPTFKVHTPKLAKAYTMTVAELLGSPRQEDDEYSQAITWHPSYKTAKTMAGLNGALTGNSVHAVSPNGWYSVGRASVKDAVSSVRFFQSGPASVLPTLSNKEQWLPRAVNNDGIVVGNALGSAPDFRFTPVYADPQFGVTELVPSTVPGLKEGAPFEVMGIDAEGRVWASTVDGEIGRTVILTPKYPAKRR